VQILTQKLDVLQSATAGVGAAGAAVHNAVTAAVTGVTNGMLQITHTHKCVCICKIAGESPQYL
jgi:hypothetical protein